MPYVIQVRLFRNTITGINYLNVILNFENFLISFLGMLKEIIFYKRRR